MPAVEPGQIRNLALAGHRGTGKTSLVEALLFQSGATTRLGTVEAGTTVSDWDEDERKRQLSLQASICHVLWRGKKLNLIDTPGDAGFQGDLLAALRVVEGVVLVVSGVMGIEVQTGRIWKRAEELGLARCLVVNMLDRERADFFRVLSQLQSQLSPHCIAVQVPIGAEHELKGVVDLLHMKAYMSAEGGKEAATSEIPAEIADTVAEHREKLLDAIAETDEALMERYLEGEEIEGEELAGALEQAILRGELFPVACAVATKNLGSTALLDLASECMPSPVEKGAPTGLGEVGSGAFIFKTIADPFAGRINVFRVVGGSVKSDSTLTNPRTRGKERVGQLLLMQGKEHSSAESIGEGDIAAVAKLKDTQTGDALLDSDRHVELAAIGFPEPVMSFAIAPKAKGDEEKMASALRRLAEEDPTLLLRRDQQTGEQLLSGMSQMHVEVAVERLKRRFGVEVELHQPRVPYLETIRKEARGHGRYKKQTGGRGQFGDCHIVIEPIGADAGYEFLDKIVGGVIPQSFRPAVDKGIQEAMRRGELAGAPVKGVRVRLVDGSYHTVDSSEMAFKIAGSMILKEAVRRADPVLLEPMMSVEVRTPEVYMGEVIGDLNSRRGQIHAMEDISGAKVVRAVVPLSEMFGYVGDLRSKTQGRANYTMQFDSYAEVPKNVAEEIIKKIRGE